MGSAAVSKDLFAAWIAGPSPAAATQLGQALPVPGSVALRGRFHFLTDPTLPPMPNELFRLSERHGSARST